MGRLKDILLVLSFAAVAGLAACGSGNGAAGRSQPAGPAASKLDSAATGRFTALLADYYRLKDALVRTNSTGADSAATAMQNKIRSIQAAADTNWINRDSLLLHLDSMASNLDKITAVKDESCETKRIYFKPVSDALYAALRSIQLRHVPVYHIFCPMAFREKGAFWLSNAPEIRNPYFGAKMIECGEVIDTLQ